MTTPKLLRQIAILMAAVRDLEFALCEARPDGPQLAQTIAEGHHRILVDEHLGLIEFTRMDGEQKEWIETIAIDYDRPESWGHLASLTLGEGMVRH